MIVAGYFAFVVALTFLGTVRWVRLGPDEAHGAACAPAGGPQTPSRGSRDAEPPPGASQAPSRPSPTWSQP